MTPYLVLGQREFTTNTGGTSATTLRGPGAVFYDGEHLIVADVDNNRVLIWNRLPTTNQQAADLVLGQANFATSTSGTPYEIR